MKTGSKMTRKNKIFRKTKNFWFGTISSRCLSLKVISLESACRRNQIKLNKIKKESKRPLIFGILYLIYM